MQCRSHPGRLTSHSAGPPSRPTGRDFFGLRGVCLWLRYVERMNNSARPERQLVRSRSHQVCFLIVAAAFVAMAIGFVVTGAGLHDPVPQFVAALIFLGLAGAAVRWSFASVVFDYRAGLLVVRNPLIAHSVPLSEVYGFEVVNSWIPGGNGQIRQKVKLKRKDGSRLTVVGACALGDYVFRMVNELDSASVPRDHTERATPPPQLT